MDKIEQSGRGTAVRGVTFCNLRFADDIDMIDDVVELKNMIQVLNDEGKRYGLEMNIEKTKTLVFGSRNMDLRISVENREIENVESFVYLGCMFTWDLGCKKRNCVESSKSCQY